MTSNVTYNGDLRTTCVHLKSGEEIITDAPTDNNGKGEAFSPTDLLATSLASCMLTIMGIKCNNLEDVDITGTYANVTKIMVDSPRRVSEIKIEMFFPENNWSQKVKSSLELSAINCPVAKSISTDIKVSVAFNF